MTDEYKKFQPIEPTEIMVRWYGYPQFKQAFIDWKEAWFQQREATGVVGYEGTKETRFWKAYAKSLKAILDLQNKRLYKTEKERDNLLSELRKYK